MKVLALLHQYVPVRNAGAETMVHSMLSALAAAGHDVHVSLSVQVGAPYVHDGVHVWPRIEGMKVDHARRIQGAHVLISHLDNSEAASFFGHLNNIPVVLVHHNTFDVTRKMLHFYGARVDLVVVNSLWMENDLIDWHKRRELPCPHTLIVRPLVDDLPGPIDGPHDRVTLVNLKKLEPDSGDRAMLTKGAETFWAVAKRMSNTQFLGVQGAYGVQQIEDLPNVEVIGHVPSPQMRELVYARTRVLVVPSNYESWGRVATEATACGIPVIAADTPGLRENLGAAGTFLDWQDVDGWVKALHGLAKPAAYAAAVKRSLARAEEHRQMRDEDTRRWVDAVQALARVLVR